MVRTGVLLTAFGGPSELEGIAPFMRSLLGCEPSADALDEARLRYLTIGGGSPLPAMAERVAVQLERSLNGLPFAYDLDEEQPAILGVHAKLPRATAGVAVPVVVGMLHSEPSIASAAKTLAAAEVRRIVSLSLSPFEAAVTTGASREAVRAAALAEGLEVVEAGDYRRSEPFLIMLADFAAEALESEEIAPHRPVVVFTAHSLPAPDAENDPTYVEQLREIAGAVADRVGLGPADGFEALTGVEAFGGGSGSHPWLLAFQSKGRRGGRWLTPELDQVIDAAAAQDFGAVVVSPIGFAIDHMETLYDLDVCAADRALSAGLEFARARVPNDSGPMIEALDGAVRKVL
jgi:protoporphyrin/coproporphyrin ferrochelatase